MTPFDATVSVAGSVVTLIDADGTTRSYSEAFEDDYRSNIDQDSQILREGSQLVLYRFNGDKWFFDESGTNAGKLMKIRSRTTHEITVTRDGNGRIEKVTDGFGRETKFYYISTGGSTRLSEIREPTPGDVGWLSTYFTYSSGLLVGVTNPVGETQRFAYDGSGRLEYAIDGRGHATEYAYDGSNRVTSITDPASNETTIAYTSSTVRTVTNRLADNTVFTFDESVTSFAYDVDKGGRPLAVTNAAGKFTQLAVDPLGQQRGDTKWASKTSSTREYQYLFAYDPNGNRLTQFKDGTLTAYTYGDNDQILTAGSDTFTFDHFGNMKTKVSGGNTTTYGWDFESNLLSIDFPGTSNDDSHEYDGAGRRMRSKFNGAANWTNYVWDESNDTLLAEYTLISGTYTIKSENTWGLGLISTNRESTKRYYHFDGEGNTMALTDTNESVTDTYGYAAAGVPVAAEDSGTSVNPFRWMGQWGAYDDGAMGSAAALILERTNLYMPSLGIYLSSINPSEFTRLDFLPHPLFAKIPSCLSRRSDNGMFLNRVLGPSGADKISGAACMNICMHTFCPKSQDADCAKRCIDICYALVRRGMVQGCAWLWKMCHGLKSDHGIKTCLVFYNSICCGL